MLAESLLCCRRRKAQTATKRPRPCAQPHSPRGAVHLLRVRVRVPRIRERKRVKKQRPSAKSHARSFSESLKALPPSLLPWEECRRFAQSRASLGRHLRAPPRARGRAGPCGAAGERGAVRRGRLLPRGGGAAGSGGGGSPRTRFRTRGRPLRAPPGRAGSAGRWRGGGGCCCCAASCWGCWAAAAGSAAAESTATAGWTGRAATTTASSAQRASTLRPPPSAAAPARCVTVARPPRRGWSRAAAPTTESLRSRRSAPVSVAARGAAQPRAPEG